MYYDPLRPYGATVKDPFFDMDGDGIVDKHDPFIVLTVIK